MSKMTILKGDITQQAVEVIVNAANIYLMGGGGVDGAIHTAAGSELLTECKLLGGCKVGEAKITHGYRLPAKYVIHTVGPRYGSEAGKEAELLTSCYKKSLLLAKEHGCKTIAFPAISIGVFRYPVVEASRIALQTIQDFIAQDDFFDEIRFVLYTEDIANMYRTLL